jgi:photosystem II stability/assembly factor-like uncharacterized protein
LDQNTGFVGGQSGIILKTTDSGLSWTALPIVDADSASITDIWFTSSSVGFYSTILGKVFVTNNGGSTWTLSGSTQGGIALYCLEFSDASKGFGGGLLGAYLYTTNAGGSVSVSPAALDDMGLEVIPNPSHGKFKLIASQQNTGMQVEISITDLEGRLILQASVPSMELNDGMDLQLDAPAGIYALTIKTDVNRKTVRLVVE